MQPAARFVRRRPAAALAFAALALALAWPQQGPGWEENSHYALIRALASGTPRIDRSLHEIGDLSTGDVAVYHGHRYSDKAPGFAFASLPPFLVLDAAGMRTTGDPANIEWALGLVSVVLPTLLVLLSVAWVVERLEPGLGAVTAVALGLGTLLLPFASMFFSHALAAALGFGAFALLLLKRGAAAAAAAGVLAGLAFTTEYPTAVAAATLAVFAAIAGIRRLGLYLAGLAFGVAPLLAYHAWAFGSPFRLSYAHRRGLHHGFYGLGAPDLHALGSLLFSAQGLLVVSPVVGAGVAGIVLLFRSGRRAEALVPAAILVAYLIWDSAFRDHFGGLQPGPRYLIFVLPFLGVPLGVVLRRFPTTGVTLALAGAVGLVLITATGSHAAYDGNWLHRVREHGFVLTAAQNIGVTGWVAMLPFFPACVAAAVFAWSDARAHLRPSRLDLAVAVIVAAAWAAAAVAARNAHGSELPAAYAAAVAAGAFVVAASATGALRLPSVGSPRKEQRVKVARRGL